MTKPLRDPDELTRAEYRDQYARVIEEIRRVADDAPNRSGAFCLSYATDRAGGVRELRILHDKATGRAHAAAIKHGDGVLELILPDYMKGEGPDWSPPLMPEWWQIEEWQMQNIAIRQWRRLRREVGADAVERIQALGELSPDMQNCAWRCWRAICRRESVRETVRGVRSEIPWGGGKETSFASAVNREYRRLLNQDTARLARKMFDDEEKEPTVAQYNYVHRNKAVLKRLDAKAPLAVQIWARFLSAPDLAADAPRLNPARVIDFARRLTRATDQEWRALSQWDGRLGLAMLPRSHRPDRCSQREWRDHAPEAGPARVCPACYDRTANYLIERRPAAALISAANVPEPDPKLANRLFSAAFANLAYRLREGGWSANPRCTPWQAGAHLVNRYLTEGADTPERSASHVFDMLSDAMIRDRPWRRSERWDDYARRGTRWMQEVQEQAGQRRRDDLELTWDSPAPSFRDAAGALAEPVTRSQDLSSLGARMNNCLASYARRCALGNDAVYAVSDDDGSLFGAVHITRQNPGQPWQAGDAEIMGETRWQRRQSRDYMLGLAAQAARLANDRADHAVAAAAADDRNEGEAI